MEESLAEANGVGNDRVRPRTFTPSVNLGSAVGINRRGAETWRMSEIEELAVPSFHQPGEREYLAAVSHEILAFNGLLLCASAVQKQL